MSLSIVLVDDDVDILYSLLGFIEPYARTRLAHCSKEALGLLSHGGVDAVLTDYRMPGEDGLTLLGAVRARWPETRRMLMSAHDACHFEGHPFASATEVFIKKPFAPSAIERALSAVGFQVPELLHPPFRGRRNAE